MARFTFAKWADIALVIFKDKSAGNIAVANDGGGCRFGRQYRSSTAATMNDFAVDDGVSVGFAESLAGLINSLLQYRDESSSS